MDTQSKPVVRLLEVIGQEFPGYHTHGDMLRDASVAMTAACGALGAQMLLRDPSGVLLGKFIRMLQTQTEAFAHGAVAQLNDQRSKMT